MYLSKIIFILAATIFMSVANAETNPATCAANFIILDKSAKASGQTEKSNAISLLLAKVYADAFEKYGNQMKPTIKNNLKKQRALIDKNGNPSPSLSNSMTDCINLYSK